MIYNNNKQANINKYIKQILVIFSNTIITSSVNDE